MRYGRRYTCVHLFLCLLVWSCKHNTGMGKVVQAESLRKL